MTRLTVRHSTEYRYCQPVYLAPHRLMLRPRDSHALRLVDTELTISPPAVLEWSHDVFGNSVAVATFNTSATMLRIDSILKVERFGGDVPAYQVDPRAVSYPFSYSEADRIDLGALLALQYNDPQGRLLSWARHFIRGLRPRSLDLLIDLNNGIRSWFSYQTRDEEGTQSPLQTLDRGWGCCRDFAVLLAEAARSLGFGARIVTGYLDTLVEQGWIVNGAGATHAWVDIYLPGAGWVAFDPTNGTVGGAGLIPVAVARDIGQIIPISGSYVGTGGDYLGMTVDVTVLPDWFQT
jgi:transglutaminase-like putative cysteine protease